jgi:hypothetical protein
MKRNVKLLAPGLVLAIALAGCAGTAKVTTPPEAGQAVLSGKVVETMNSGGYTYVNIEKDGKRGWVAVPTTEVKVGDEVDLLPGAEMGPFTSPSLNRTFDKIIFSGGPAHKQPAAAMPSGHPSISAPPKNIPAPPTNLTAPSVDKPFYAGKVVETMNAAGYTYICIEKDGKKSWAAVPPATVKVGEEIEIQPGTEMGTFTSKTMNRTFDNIIFSPGIIKKK